MIAKKSYPVKKFALKSVNRDKINTEVDIIQSELNILKKIEHPNIIDLYEIYMDDNHFNFVTQLCEGLDLFCHLD